MRNSRCVLILAALAVSCDSGGPTAPTTPPKVLPQTPTSCTFRTDRPYFDDRVGWFAYDVRWFPPEQQGSDPVTTYEVELTRAAVIGDVNSQGVYEIEQTRNMPVVTQTVRAKTGTTNDLHSINDVATFPVCEMLVRNEDLLFRAKVRANSVAGMSLPFACVDAQRLWDGIVLTIADDSSGYWRYHCNGAGAAPTEHVSTWVIGIPAN